MVANLAHPNRIDKTNMNTLNLSTKDARHLETTIESQVLTICMNTPRKLNGWTLDMMMAIKNAMEAATKHADIKAIILTGAGEAFC